MRSKYINNWSNSIINKRKRPAKESADKVNTTWILPNLLTRKHSWRVLSRSIPGGLVALTPILQRVETWCKLQIWSMQIQAHNFQKYKWCNKTISKRKVASMVALAWIKISQRYRQHHLLIIKIINKVKRKIVWVDLMDQGCTWEAPICLEALAPSLAARTTLGRVNRVS